MTESIGDELGGVIGAVGVTLVGLKAISLIDKNLSGESAMPAGRRRQGMPRTDIERLQRHFGKDWWKHDVSELPPRGAGLKRRRSRTTKKRTRKGGGRRKPRRRR